MRTLTSCQSFLIRLEWGYMLCFDVFSIFPEVFTPYLDLSILQRAIQRGLVQVNLYNIRDWTVDKHHTTDDLPYGGGGGMVMKPEPIFEAVEAIMGSPPVSPVILLTPQGRLFNQKIAMELAGHANTSSPDTTDAAHEGRIGLICGRYEGVDERVRQFLATDELSIGDYVITGGELPALIVMDAVTRLIPGTLGDPTGAETDSHARGLLEYPHYTRPAIFRNYPVPDVLISGDHARIERWRREQSLLRTWQRRPDLLMSASLTREEQEFLDHLKHDP